MRDKPAPISCTPSISRHARPAILATTESAIAVLPCSVASSDRRVTDDERDRFSPPVEAGDGDDDVDVVDGAAFEAADSVMEPP